MTATRDRPQTLEALLAEHGQAIGCFAYLILQHQADAERILGCDAGDGPCARRPTAGTTRAPSAAASNRRPGDSAWRGANR